MIVFAAMMAMAAFTACGDDNASRTMLGGEMLKNISMVIADQADAEKLYQAEEDAPNMILVADSKEAAHKLCERLIADTWDGKPRTVQLPDGCGIISLAPAADESIFCTVSFTGLKSCDYPVFSLTIAPKEYLDGDNPAITMNSANRYVYGDVAIAVGGPMPVCPSAINAVVAEARILSNLRDKDK